MTTGIELIATERNEQIIKHRRSIKSDVLENDKYQLLYAATSLLHSPDEMSAMELILSMDKLDNWNESILKKMDAKPYKERLIIAGALIAAEIDRLNHKP